MFDDPTWCLEFILSHLEEKYLNKVTLLENSLKILQARFLYVFGQNSVCLFEAITQSDEIISQVL